jgi:hypothetical protein
MAAGAAEQELWRLLSNAQIRDADPLTLEAQHQMEQLTAEQGAQRIRLMLEADPGIRDELSVSALLAFLLGNVAPLGQKQRLSLGRAEKGEAG